MKNFKCRKQTVLRINKDGIKYNVENHLRVFLDLSPHLRNGDIIILNIKFLQRIIIITFVKTYSAVPEGK